MTTSAMIVSLGEKPTYPFWHDGTKSHLAFSMAVPEGIVVYVRVFELFEGTILVSESPARYGDFEGKFLRNDPVTGNVREVDLVDEFARLGDDAVPEE